jgi:hypothetical protein
MNECQRADYLILLNGGSVRRLHNITKEAAICKAYTESNDYYHTVTLVEVIGTVEIEARWVDAKEQTK